jgi:hypothetical protein
MSSLVEQGNFLLIVSSGLRNRQDIEDVKVERQKTAE